MNGSFSARSHGALSEIRLEYFLIMRGIEFNAVLAIWRSRLEFVSPTRCVFSCVNGIEAEVGSLITRRTLDSRQHGSIQCGLEKVAKVPCSSSRAASRPQI